MLELAFLFAVLLLVIIVVLLSIVVHSVSRVIRGIQRVADADTRFRQWTYRLEAGVTGGSMEGFKKNINGLGEAGWEAVAAWTENEDAVPPREARGFVFVLFKHLSGT
jgi:hypothetical protein